MREFVARSDKEDVKQLHSGQSDKKKGPAVYGESAALALVSSGRSGLKGAPAGVAWLRQQHARAVHHLLGQSALHELVPGARFWASDGNANNAGHFRALLLWLFAALFRPLKTARSQNGPAGFWAFRPRASK